MRARLTRSAADGALLGHPISRLHRSLFFSAGDRYGGLLFFLLSTAILSRLLTPEEFGIYTAIAALTGLANALREFGGANYLIQKSTLSEQNVRTAFSITFCMSALLGAMLFWLRDVAASFFSHDGLRDGIAVSALNFLLSPFSVTISALLRREMAFGAVARCNLAANFVTAVTSVALAALGYSFMGPVWGSVLAISHYSRRSCLAGATCGSSARAFTSAVM